MRLSLLLLFSPMLFGSDVYITQTTSGGDTGANCANAHSATWFNSNATGGNTYHLCGTFTGASGATMFTLPASGSLGNLLTMYFESGAVLTSPRWANQLGAINTNSKQYVLIDGGVNGIIENTDNGSALAQHSPSFGISAVGCVGCEIKNLTIRNIYIHSLTSDTVVDQTLVRAIDFSGTNILVHDNIAHDAGWALTLGYANGDTGAQVYNNDIYNIDHAFVLSSGGAMTGGTFKFYNNHAHDYAKWDSTGCAYHHDGIHAFGVNHSGSLPVVQNFWIYNNLFDGAMGSCITGQIFLEGTSQGTPWTDATGIAHVFNNVNLAGSSFQINSGHNHEIYNNTIVFTNPGVTATAAITVLGATGQVIKNNFMSGYGALINTNDTTNTDYNAYASCTSFNCWGGGGVSPTNNWTTWKSGCGCDSHSVQQISGDGGVSTVTGMPVVGSEVIGAGANLTSLGITALNSDKSGIPRPASGAWTVGAYQYVGTSTATGTMTGTSR